MYDFFFVLIPEHFPYLLQGAVVTLELSVLSMALGIVLGLVIALGRMSGRWWLEWPLRAYVEIWRDVPLIVQLLVIYFTLPTIGIVLPGFWAGILGLSLNMGRICRKCSGRRSSRSTRASARQACRSACRGR